MRCEVSALCPSSPVTVGAFEPHADACISSAYLFLNEAVDGFDIHALSLKTRSDAPYQAAMLLLTLT